VPTVLTPPAFLCPHTGIDQVTVFIPAVLHGVAAAARTPVLLVIESKTDGVFLFRFSAERRCVGDTWHTSVDEAKSQAAFEFNELLTAWKVVPEKTEDVFLYGFAD